MSAKGPSPCVCGSYDEDGFMICCDACDSWMHGPCVKVTKHSAAGIDKYFCPRCRPRSLRKRDQDRLRAPKPKTTTTKRSAASPNAAICAKTCSLLNMSDEVLLWILAFVQCHKSICRISSTCRRLWRIAQDPQLWRHVTLTHDNSLRLHWDTIIQPRLLKSNICELNLLGEISSPVVIDGLKLELFTSLQVLRLEDIQTYTVYRLAGKLPWLRIFEARRIKGNSDIWDWRPFRNLTMLEELLLWRNEKPMQTFSLSQDISLEVPDDIYPMGEEHIWGGFVQLSSPGSSDSGSGSDSDDNNNNDSDGDGDGDTHSSPDDIMSEYSSQSVQGSEHSSLSAKRSPRSPMMPRLNRLALINIVSPSTHRGTDGVMRDLVSRVSTYIHWNSLNILFPVVKTQYEKLEHLTLVEACEPAWREGTWQEHAAVFQRMGCLESITMINPNMNRRFLIPILDALLSLARLRHIRLISTDDLETVNAALAHILERRWSGRLLISIQDDFGADGASREWRAKAIDRVNEANRREEQPDRRLDFDVRLFRTNRDDDAGLKILCLKAWQQTL